MLQNFCCQIHNQWIKSNINQEAKKLKSVAQCNQNLKTQNVQ